MKLEREFSRGLRLKVSRFDNNVPNSDSIIGFGTNYDHTMVFCFKLPGAKTNFLKVEWHIANQFVDWNRIKPALIWSLECNGKLLKGGLIKKFRMHIHQFSQIPTKSYFNIKPLIIFPILHFAGRPPFVNSIKYQQGLDVQNFTPQIIGIIASWRESADNCLLDLFPQKSISSTRKGINTSHLKLATLFFKCYRCQEPILYPWVLMHRCLQDKVLDKEESDKDKAKHVDADVDSIWNQMSFWYGTECNEDNHQVIFDDEASGFAQVIMQAFGRDPGKAKSDEMNNIDARVKCLRCSKKGLNSKRLVMNWTTAAIIFLHVWLKYHWNCFTLDSAWNQQTFQQNSSWAKLVINGYWTKQI